MLIPLPPQSRTMRFCNVILTEPLYSQFDQERMLIPLPEWQTKSKKKKNQAIPNKKWQLSIHVYHLFKLVQRHHIFIRICSSCVRLFEFTCIFCNLWPFLQLCCLSVCRFVKVCVRMSVSGTSRDSTCMRVCVSNSDKRPCSLDLRITQQWQIVSLSPALITTLDPNWEFHLQTVRFDEQIFVQLRMGVQAEYF